METVMLNTNVFGRLYDDISQNRILQEALDCLHIFLLSITKPVVIKSSDVLFAELTLIKGEAKRELVLGLVNKICEERVRLNEQIIGLADDIYPIVNDYMDSLHISFAATNCTYFATCDKDIIKNREKIVKLLKSRGFNLNIKNPSEFVK